MEQIRKVFLSSTSSDLAECREKVIDALQRLDDWDVIHMERFGARTWTADDFCLKKVRECDVFVGIAGFCYGSVHKPSGASYTEREYDEAVRVARPRLMYVAPDDFKVEAKVLLADGNPDRQAAFREVIDSQQIRDEFESPENLAKRVVVDLGNWERESHLARQPVQASEDLEQLDTGNTGFGGSDNYDSSLCRFSLYDIDEQGFRNHLSSAPSGTPHPSDDLPLAMLLEHFGLYREGKLTNAAILLFGKRPQLLNPSAVVRCTRFKGRDKGIRQIGAILHAKAVSASAGRVCD